MRDAGCHENITNPIFPLKVGFIGIKSLIILPASGIVEFVEGCVDHFYDSKPEAAVQEKNRCIQYFVGKGCEVCIDGYDEARSCIEVKLLV